ncbi:hypothetical protein [Pseudorhodobacter sp. MZDSW-24AT]|uniref:hypothetical protein n=1 Tax=Pseudorhodobacter sp. MZDSW-24AT TaxID=2052957 RepID=UPI0012FE31B7|nr:hypothetical protein [Pseudorhodobacter sp. MZDSW-24AT]
MSKHAWIISNLIDIIDYAEKEGLESVSRTLSRSMARIAPELQRQAAQTSVAAEIIPLHLYLNLKRDVTSAEHNGASSDCLAHDSSAVLGREPV